MAQLLTQMAQLLTQSEVADALKVSYATVGRWKKAGIIVPAIQIGKIARFDLDDVKDAIEARHNEEEEQQPQQETT